jgi:alpha,alpha-trehalase
MTTKRLRLQETRGVIFDLDGVMTDTAGFHADAWKQLFDEYLSQRSERGDEDHRPFTMEDYRRDVDGKARNDGVASFLSSRGIDLPDGEASDPPGRETICGLGNRKNGYFRERLELDGARVFGDALALVEQLHDLHVPTAIISASRNCELVLRTADIDHLFDVRVDGVVADELGLPGKPDPAILLEAASRLDVPADDAVIIEDALAGVEAGHRGGFGLVIGVDRDAHGGLTGAGADIAVTDLSAVEVVPFGDGACQPADAGTTGEVGAMPVEVRLEASVEANVEVSDIDEVPDAVEHWPALMERMGARRPVLFLDFDGTLSPIVEHPGDVRLPDDAATAIRRVAELTFVAVVSGRDLRDVRRQIHLDSIWYAGSHGFEIGGPDGEHHEIDGAVDALPDLDQAQRDIESSIGDIPGAEVDRKRFSIATHYRNVANDRIDEVVAAAEEAAERSGLRSSRGRKVVEVQPDVDWHKGRAVDYLMNGSMNGSMNELDLDAQPVVPVFIGDGTTDEDAFESIAGSGIGIVVRHDERSLPSTAATFAVDGPGSVPALLDRFAELLASTTGAPANGGDLA